MTKAKPDKSNFERLLWLTIINRTQKNRGPKQAQAFMWSPSRLEWMPLPRPQNDTFHLEYTYRSCRNLCFSLLTKQFRLSRQFFYGRVQTYHYDDDDAADNWNKSSNMTLINRYKRSRVSVNPVALMWALILHLLIDFVVSILFSLAIYTHACTATRNRNDVSEVLLALRSLSEERDTKKNCRINRYVWCFPFMLKTDILLTRRRNSTVTLSVSLCIRGRLF